MNGWYRELEATVAELSERLGDALRRIEILESQARPVAVVEKAALLHAPVLEGQPVKSAAASVDDWIANRMAKKKLGRPKKVEATVNG